MSVRLATDEAALYAFLRCDEVQKVDSGDTMRAVTASIGEFSGAQSVDRALRLLGLIGRETTDGVALSSLIDESDLNKPTARRLLLALMRARLVEQDPKTRRYFLGEEAFVLGVLAGRRHGLLEMALPGLRRLSQRTMDTCFLSVRRDHHYAACLHREEGTYPVRTHALQAGDQHPLGIGAGSLAMLAALSDDEVDRSLAATAGAIERRYPGFPPAQIRADLALARERGFALNPGRVVASSWGIGVAIRLPGGRVAGALSIAAIDSRMGPDRQSELAALLGEEARLIEARFGTERPGREGRAPEARVA